MSVCNWYEEVCAIVKGKMRLILKLRDAQSMPNRMHIANKKKSDRLQILWGIYSYKLEDEFPGNIWGILTGLICVRIHDNQF